MKNGRWMYVAILAALVTFGCATSPTVATVAAAADVYAPPEQELMWLNILVGPDVMVSVCQDGSIKFGPKYEPDQTARIFWANMERQLGTLYLSDVNIKSMAESGTLCAVYQHNIVGGVCVLCGAKEGE